MLENNNEKLEKDTRKYFVSREGVVTSFYHIEDENIDIAKNRYGISPNEILSLNGEQISSIIDQAHEAGKRCTFRTLDNLDSIVVAEKRLDTNIRNLKIDAKIETILMKLKELTDEQRLEIAERIGTGDYETCTIFSEIKEYAESKKVTTVTVSSVYLFTRAVEDVMQAINLLRNLRRIGIHIYFKNDGVWTGKPIHDLDIGALCVLAMCDDVVEDTTTSKLF